MPYSEIYYHLIWRTKNSEPLITSRIERQVHRAIWKKTLGLGAMVFAVGGITDHVHLSVSLPPSLASADFLGDVKGYSSWFVNKEKLVAGHFQWQTEYGVFSHDRKRLPHVVAYVKNQKQHHAGADTIARLERTTDPRGSEVREPETPYNLDDTMWRKELEEMDREDGFLPPSADGRPG